METDVMDQETIAALEEDARPTDVPRKFYNHQNIEELHEDLLNLDREVQARGYEYVLAFDTETTGLSPLNDKLILVQLYHEKFPAFIIDVRQVDRRMVLSLLKLFVGDKWLKVAHHAKFDAEFLYTHYGLTLRRLFCTKLSEDLLTAGLNEDSKLQTILSKYLGVDMTKEVRDQFLTVGDGPITEEMQRYAAEDVRYLPRLMRVLTKRLEAEELIKVAKLEFSIIPALVRASMHGVMIDRERWESHIATIDEEAKLKEAQLQEQLQPYIEAHREKRYNEAVGVFLPLMAEYEAARAYRDSEAVHHKESLLREGKGAGEAQRLLNEWKKINPPPTKPKQPRLVEGPINLGSPEQLGGSLVQMGVPLSAKPNGTYETDKHSLKRLGDEWEVCADICEWREYQKMVTAFGEAVLKYVDKNVRLHPSYNQLVSTGRMSCQHPNIQQVPDNRIGKEFRRCFIAPPGKKLVAADYSQIELRILAELSEEPNMLHAFESGLDLHSITASRMFNVPFEEVADENGKHRHLRKAAKAINFGIAYGLSPAGLSRNERIPIDDAKHYIDAYFEANPKLREWLTRTARVGLARLYAETMLGRRRYFHPIPISRAENPREYERIKSSYKRMITNHPIQGTSADITKLAIYKLHQQFSRTKAVPILFVHDEIVVEVEEDEAELCAEVMVEEMKAAAIHFLKVVPVDVSYKISDTWEH